MPIWITALGVAGMGAMYGYFAFYVLKRYLPPVTSEPPQMRELLFLLVTIGLSGAIGAPFAEADGVSYIGPYGLGLLIGVLGNLVVSVVYEAVCYRRWLRENAGQ